MKPPSSAKVKDDVDHEESEMEEGNSEDEVDDSTLKRKLQEDSEDDDDEDVDRLDNDDYDLLEENTGIRFKKKFRRVKVLDDDDSDDASTTVGTREQIAEELFDLDDDAETTVAPSKPPATPKAYSSEESSEDEIDDFIVDDSGAPVRKKKRRKSFFVRIGDIDATDERLQSAQDIFGVDFEVEDLDGNVDNDDSEDEETRHPRSKELKKPVTLEQIYEPAVLENLHYSELDVSIRQTDIPERFQRQGFEGIVSRHLHVKQTKEQLIKLINDEAAWIYEEMIKTNQFSTKPTGPESQAAANARDVWDDDAASSVSGVPAGRMCESDGESIISTSSARGKKTKVPDDDDDWETGTTNQPTAKASDAVERANKAWGDDDWETESTNNSRNPARANKDGDDDDWETGTVSAFPVKATEAVASGKKDGNTVNKDNDDDDWETGTVSAFPVKATEAVASGKKDGNTVSKDNDDYDDWETGTVSAFPVKATEAVASGKKDGNTVNKDNDDDDWETGTVSAFPVKAKATEAVASGKKDGNTVSKDDDDDWETGTVSAFPVRGNDETGSVVSQRAKARNSDKVGPTTISDAKAQEEKRREVTSSIAEVLAYMQVEFLEVPYIIRYRKDAYVGRLLEEHIWLIYHLDIKYAKLYKSIRSLQALATSTCTFLSEEKNKEWITSNFGCNCRPFREDDVSFINNCKSFEELSDYRSFYTLYYGKLTPVMKSLRRKLKLASGKEQNNGENDAYSELSCSFSQLDQTDGLSQLVPLPANETLRVIRLSKYERLHSELRDVADTIGISMSELAINIVEEYAKYKKDPPSVGSDELAQLHTSKMSPNSTTAVTTNEQVLEGIQTILATQFSREPSIKKILRSYIWNSDTMCTLTVYPTEKGVKVIDEFHMLFPFKYVTNKKISDFRGDCFLKLLNGEQDKLIEVRFSSEFIIRIRALFQSWLPFYLEDGCSLIIQDWNKFRKSVIEKSVLEIMLPQFLKEVKSRLETEAKDFIAKECRKQIRNIINVGKLKMKTEYEPDDDGGIRVMAVAYEADPSLAPFACVMKSGGTELVDYCTLGNLMLCHRSNEGLCAEVKDQIAKFLLKTKPHFIVIGGESLDADNVADLVRQAVESLRQPTIDLDDLSFESFPEVQVEIIPNFAAKVYSLSKLATTEYGEYPIILRQAISLARSVLDPLVELGQLYNSDEDILCINFHPFQGKIDKQRLLEEIEEEFVGIVNIVGVDFNECLKDSRKGHMLQFVCGLGPAKAAFLLRIFRRKTTGLLLNRDQLHSVGKLEPITFTNCAGFIRISVKDLESGSDDAFVEYLDSTRIHPNNYLHARYIAHDAMAVEDDQFDETVVEVEHVQKILDDPETHSDAVKELNIDEYNKYLMATERRANMTKVLEDIVEEFCAPFKDPRPDFTPPSIEESFYFMTKETPDTIHVGKLLNAKVVGFSKSRCEVESGTIFGTSCPKCNVGCDTNADLLKHVTNPKGIHIMLDNGLRGYMHANMLSDSPDVLVKERVKLGQVIVCRILMFDPAKRMVQLTSRSSDLRGENDDLKPAKDPAYDESRALEDERKLMKAPPAKSSGVVYQKRAIAHACFYNITYQDCKRRLDNMDNGDAIFRPSSKGPDHLTLSWKVMDNVMQHVDIIEKKQQNGTVYILEDEEYEDLDEILTRYVYPMGSFVRDIIGHKYFMPISESQHQREVESILRDKYSVNPRQMPYVFTAIPERPGRFLLSYVLGGSLSRKLYFRHEPIKIVSDGYYYRHLTLESLSKLLNYFKRHFREIPPAHTPMIGSATMTGSVQLF